MLRPPASVRITIIRGVIGFDNSNKTIIELTAKSRHDFIHTRARGGLQARHASVDIPTESDIGP